jgi:GxxExxY protein
LGFCDSSAISAASCSKQSFSSQQIRNRFEQEQSESIADCCAYFGTVLVVSVIYYSRNQQRLNCQDFSIMHPFFKKAAGLTESIIGGAIEVHRDKGPGLLEPIYEWCLVKELGLRNLQCMSQKIVVIEYKGFTRDEPLRFDVLVENCVLVEAKAVEKVLPIHKAQLLSYMKLLNVPIGLLINFHEMKVVDGVSRLILPGADGN